MYVYIFVTWATTVCLIYTPEARGPQAQGLRVYTVDPKTFIAINVTLSKISKRFNFVNNLVYKIKYHTEFKYTDITMHLILGLTHVVNDGRLVEPLDWFAL